MGMDERDSNKTSSRTNYIDNVLLQNNANNNRNRVPVPTTRIIKTTNSTRSTSAGRESRGQIYSKKSMDDLLNIKNLSVSPPKNCGSTITTTTTPTRRVPISRISLKYLRPSLASSTNSLNSLNHSVASSTSSLSDHNGSKSCLKIETNFS